MKHTLRTLLSLFIIILCYGCLSINTKKYSALGTWKLKRIEQQGSKAGSLNSYVAKQGELLNLFKDSTLSVLSEEAQQIGKWTINDGILTIKAENSSTKSYEMKFSTTKSGLEILKLKDEGSGNVSVFYREALPLKDLSNEPFHPSNIQWRIKATTSESIPQLKQRLENYVKHVSLILYVAIQQKPELVSFELSQGPIRIYSSGIGKFPFAVVKPVWKNAYYSEQEAAIAYQLYENYLRDNKYTGTSTGKWVDDDYAILQSIYNGLKRDAKTDREKIAK